MKLDTIKNEMAAGGSVSVADPDDTPDPVTAIVGIGAWLALFVALAFLNVWFLVFVLGLLVSIFLHEVGHFVTARRSGMKVTQFFMGFGPRIWSFHRDGIEYGIRAIPLGAFVRIIGMNNLDEVPLEDEPYTYRQQSYPKRMLVITAGSVMHMLIAITLITGVYLTAGRLEESGRVVVVGTGRPHDTGRCRRPPPGRRHHRHRWRADDAGRRGAFGAALDRTRRHDRARRRP